MFARSFSIGGVLGLLGFDSVVCAFVGLLDLDLYDLLEDLFDLGSLVSGLLDLLCFIRRLVRLIRRFVVAFDDLDDRFLRFFCLLGFFFDDLFLSWSFVCGVAHDNVDRIGERASGVRSLVADRVWVALKVWFRKERDRSGNRADEPVSLARDDNHTRKGSRSWIDKHNAAWIDGEGNVVGQNVDRHDAACGVLQ